MARASEHVDTSMPSSRTSVASSLVFGSLPTTLPTDRNKTFSGQRHINIETELDPAQEIAVQNQVVWIPTYLLHLFPTTLVPSKSYRVQKLKQLNNVLWEDKTGRTRSWRTRQATNDGMTMLIKAEVCYPGFNHRDSIIL